MIKLLIVDDEKTTRDGLMELIPWKTLGVDAVRVARNGVEALQVAKIFLPDIALCDVKMPKMDGIELAKQLRKLYPETQLVFLSGYSDTAYLKSAIQLKAEDYLEKPVDRRDLAQLMERIVARIGEQRRQQAAHSKAATHLQDSIPLLRQKALQQLLSGSSNISKLAEELGTSVFPIAASKTYRIASAIFNLTDTFSPGNKGLFQNTLLELLADSDEAPQAVLAGFIGENHLAIVLENENLTQPGERGQALQALTSTIAAHCVEGCTLTISLGPAVSAANMLTGVISAQVLLARQFYEGTGILQQPGQAGCEYRPDKALKTQFRKAVREKSPEPAQRLIQQLTKQVAASKDPEIGRVKRLYYHLFLILMEECAQWGQADAGEDACVWEELEKIATLRGLEASLLSSIRSLKGNAVEKNSMLQKMEEARLYIRTHCGDQQLSIQTIAAQVYLSQTYLCAVFKKTTGQTINEYVTDIRIEKARELLSTTRMKLNDLATAIGFSDTNYFSTLFKRKTGLTPTEYRDRNIAL